MLQYWLDPFSPQLLVLHIQGGKFLSLSLPGARYPGPNSSCEVSSWQWQVYSVLPEVERHRRKRARLAQYHDADRAEVVRELFGAVQ